MIVEILKTKEREVALLKRGAFGERKRAVRPLVFDGPVNIIAELKRRSPSAGYLREIGRERIMVYGQYAKAISVLTDETYFGGSYEFLEEVADATELPILCKDFVIDRTQIDRAYAAGADLVLLIARILPKDELKALFTHARTLGLECLIELHREEEMEKVEGLGAQVIGVNGRDLDTLEMDLDRVAGTMAHVSAPFRIAESGIKSRVDLERMQGAGANGFLVGELLMRSENPESIFEELLHG